MKLSRGRDKKVINKALRQTAGNITETAKLLGIHPNNLHRLIRTLKEKRFSIDTDWRVKAKASVVAGKSSPDHPIRFATLLAPSDCDEQ